MLPNTCWLSLQEPYGYTQYQLVTSFTLHCRILLLLLLLYVNLEFVKA